MWRVVGVAVGVEVESPLVLHGAGAGGGGGQVWFTDEREGAAEAGGLLLREGRFSRGGVKVQIESPSV